MEKARSRLTTTENQDKTSSPEKPTAVQIPSFLLRYKKYIPTLGLGILNWILFYLLLTRIYPQTIQNWFIPHLYLPILVIFFFAMLFTCAFLFLNTRRGLLVAFATTCFLFLKLQQIAITIEVVSAILIFFGILEISFLMINFGLKDFITSLRVTKRKPRANLKQKTHHRKRN